MKYFVIDIETALDGKISPAIYTYSNEDEAVASYHSRMGSAMRNANVSEVLITVLDNTGNQHAQSYWKRPTEDVVD